jgi:predicted alpha/beta hydrolase
MNSATFHSPSGRVAAAASAPRGDAHALIADDGRRLAASWFEPAQGAARAVALVSSATGVPRGFYAAFAQWLAARGYAVLTYDYRGIAGSREGSLRRERATMRDWAVLDMSAALAAAEARRAGRGLPLLLVGHSFGGNCIAFARGVERADAILGVGSQLGEPRLYPGVHGAVAQVFFRAWVPAVVAGFGHLPGWALGPGAQALPSGVARQWGRWGLRRGWAYADPAMAPHRSASAVLAPVHLWGIDDDLTYAPPRAIDALAAQFRNAAVQRHQLAPADVGRRGLGHFGVFRRDPGPRAWARMLAPIEAAAPALQAAGLEPPHPA